MTYTSSDASAGMTGGTQDGDRLQEAASGIMDQASRTAEAQASTTMTKVGDTVAQVASAIRNAGSNLREQQPDIANVVDTAAEQVDGVASYLREHDARDAVDSATRWARQQPAAVIGGGLALGLLLGRFLKSGSAAQAQGGYQSGYGQGSYGYGSTGYGAAGSTGYGTTGYGTGTSGYDTAGTAGYGTTGYAGGTMAGSGSDLGMGAGGTGFGAGAAGTTYGADYTTGTGTTGALGDTAGSSYGGTDLGSDLGSTGDMAGSDNLETVTHTHVVDTDETLASDADVLGSSDRQSER